MNVTQSKARILKKAQLLVCRLKWLLTRSNSERSELNALYSIGVVTYVARYKRFFRPLLRQLVMAFPDTTIVVAANGYHDQKRQSLYLHELRKFVSRYPNVKLIEHKEPQSLSKLWNKLMIHSTTNATLILNDDVAITPSFRHNLEGSGLLGLPVALINRSWSHFVITKDIVEKAGWFDERFPAVGNEDQDYEARLALLGVAPTSKVVRGLINVVFKTKDFSYGKKVDVINQKYVRENQVFFNHKWSVSKTKVDGFVYVDILDAYVKLNQGFETPNFYPQTAQNK
jgi:hypothetical protein